MSLAIALLTVSDTRTLAEDSSGDALQQRVDFVLREDLLVHGPMPTGLGKAEVTG